MNKIIIAIDGYSSCGKSTMAKELANALGYIYVDTGAMYRCVTLYAIENGMFSGKSLDSDVEKEIRSMSGSERVSNVAKQPCVRQRLVEQQQAMGRKKGIVMDGRDIGTTVFPDAELKIFVTASPEVRAQRRYLELLEKEGRADYEEILSNVKERDYIDSHRSVSPLKMANDAILLDNSNMSLDQQREWLIDKAKEVISLS